MKKFILLGLFLGSLSVGDVSDSHGKGTISTNDFGDFHGKTGNRIATSEPGEGSSKAGCHGKAGCLI